MLHFTHAVCRFPDPIHCIDWNRQWVAITGHVQNTVIANKAKNNSDCGNGGVIINRKLVCSMHFEVEDFQGIRLKPNALPSKNLFDNPSNNQQVQNWKNNQPPFFCSFSKIISLFFSFREIHHCFRTTTLCLHRPIWINSTTSNPKAKTRQEIMTRRSILACHLLH